MGAYKRYREFGGKEQREEPRVREFREYGTVSLGGITVHTGTAVFSKLPKNLTKFDIDGTMCKMSRFYL